MNAQSNSVALIMNANLILQKCQSRHGISVPISSIDFGYLCEEMDEDEIIASADYLCINSHLSHYEFK
jgi:hypothetical protein